MATLKVYPSGYNSKASSYTEASDLTVPYRAYYPAETSGYSITQGNTSHAKIISGTSYSRSSSIVYTFKLSKLPENAIINSVTCISTASSYISSSGNSYVSLGTVTNNIYTAVTSKIALGRGFYFRNHTCSGGSWTRSSLQSCAIKFETDGYGGDTADELYIAGATLTVDYTEPPKITGYANIGGVNKELSGGYVNIGGAWKEISGAYMCVNGGTPATLPSGYTQVEYLESSGTQYIDTGFTPNQDTRVVLKQGGANSSAWGEVLGAGNSVKNPSTNFVLVQNTSNGTMFEYGAEYATGAATSDGTIVDMNKNNFYINGSLVHTFTYSAFTCPYTLRLFDAATQSEDYSRYSGKIYSCQIYDNGTLVRDFIPCQNSAGTAGLYDTVNSKFYTNAGSGTFAVGQTVGADGGIWREMAK